MAFLAGLYFLCSGEDNKKQVEKKENTFFGLNVILDLCLKLVKEDIRSVLPVLTPNGALCPIDVRTHRQGG